MNIGRESKMQNDLFFVCSLIEFIARATKNQRNVIVNTLGKKILKKYFDFADVFHCEPLQKHSSELTKKCAIAHGLFDNVANCKYTVPTVFDIAKVYKRLIFAVSNKKKSDIIDTLIEVYNSWIAPKIDDYNSSLYYENPDYIFESYCAEKILE